MDPTRLSHELREGQSPDLTRRRWVLGLSLLSAAMGQIVALYQMGLVKKLPDPPGRLGKVFDATKVDASDYAYKRMNMPDAPAMVTTYGVTAMLASAGGMDRARATPWLPIALAAKTLYDSATALTLGKEEWEDNHALCEYCQVATVASLASFALALPEAVRAARHLLGDAGSATAADAALTAA